MYDNLSARLRGEADVANVSPYIKEMMREAADSLDNLCIAIQALSSKNEHFNGEEEQEVSGWHEFEPGKYIYDEMEANP